MVPFDMYRLSRRDLSVKELAKPFKISPPAISKHLRVLEKAGLLKREKHGRVHLCRLVARPIKDAAQWTDHYRHFWEGRFDDLANYLNRPHKKKEKL